MIYKKNIFYKSVKKLRKKGSPKMPNFFILHRGEYFYKRGVYKPPRILFIFLKRIYIEHFKKGYM